MTILYMILIVIGGLGAAFFILRFRMRRAISQVITIMRAHNATDPKNAKTDVEMGLVKRGMFTLSMRGRDFKPQALQSLLQAGIVELTDDFKYYLVEEKLNGTPFDRLRMENPFRPM